MFVVIRFKLQSLTQLQSPFPHTYTPSSFITWTVSSTHHRLYHLQTQKISNSGPCNTSTQLPTYSSTGRQTLFTGSHDKAVSKWDLISRKVSHIIKPAHSRRPSTLGQGVPVKDGVSVQGRRLSLVFLELIRAEDVTAQSKILQTRFRRCLGHHQHRIQMHCKKPCWYRVNRRVSNGIRSAGRTPWFASRDDLAKDYFHLPNSSCAYIHTVRKANREVVLLEQEW